MDVPLRLLSARSFLKVVCVAVDVALLGISTQVRNADSLSDAMQYIYSADVLLATRIQT